MQDNRVFVRARCFAEMKKSMTYNADVIVCHRGIVLKAQCERGAGLSPDAQCKHVICILYGLVQEIDYQLILSKSQTIIIRFTDNSSVQEDKHAFLLFTL